MRDLWAVIAFETSQRRVVFLAAGVLSLLPWAMPLIWSGADASDLRLATAAIGGLFLSWGLAIALGATAGGSDLSSGRMAFFYAQPLSAGVIGFGKLCAVVLASAGTLLIVTAPTLLFGVTRRESLSALLPLSVVCFMTIIALAIGSHAVSVAVRARTGWLAVTAAALIGTGLATGANGFVIQRTGATALWPIVSSATLLAAIAALFVSAWLQFRSGRADLSRSGRALAIATACTLTAVAIGSILYSNWATRPSLSDLRGIQHVAQVGSGWIRVTGPARWRPGYEAAFLFRPSDGSTLPIRPQSFRAPSTYWASSAGAFVALRADPGRDSWDLSMDWVDLKTPPLRVESTGVSLFGWPSHLALSVSGERLAVIAPDALRGGRERLVVHEMPSGRVLAGTNLPEGIVSTRTRLGFDSGFDSPGEGSAPVSSDEDVLALVAVERIGGGYGVSRRTLSLGAGSLSEPTWVPGLDVPNDWEVALSWDGESAAAGRALYSIRSGLQLLTLAEPSPFGVDFLLPGGLLAQWSANRDGGTMQTLSSTLQILSSTRPPLELAFPGAGWPGFEGRLDSGELLFTLQDPQNTPASRRRGSLWLIDPDNGTRRLLHDSLCSASMSQPRTIHVVDCVGNLIEIDSQTGERHTLLVGELPHQAPGQYPNQPWMPMTLTGLWDSVTAALH